MTGTCSASHLPHTIHSASYSSPWAPQSWRPFLSQSMCTYFSWGFLCMLLVTHSQLQSESITWKIPESKDSYILDWTTFYWTHLGHDYSHCPMYPHCLWIHPPVPHTISDIRLPFLVLHGKRVHVDINPTHTDTSLHRMQVCLWLQAVTEHLVVHLPLPEVLLLSPIYLKNCNIHFWFLLGSLLSRVTFCCCLDNIKCLYFTPPLSSRVPAALHQVWLVYHHWLHSIGLGIWVVLGIRCRATHVFPPSAPRGSSSLGGGLWWVDFWSLGIYSWWGHWVHPLSICHP